MTQKKAFDKIQHPYMIKIPNKLGIEVNFLNPIKGIYKEHTANVILNSENLKVFTLILRTK